LCIFAVEKNSNAMKLKFRLQYDTVWGQTLHIRIVYRNADGRLPAERDITMQTADGSHWTAETAPVESRRLPIAAVEYEYYVADEEGQAVRREWNGVRRLYACDTSKDYSFDDRWRDVPPWLHLYSAAYATTTSMAQQRGDEQAATMPLFRQTVLFRVSAPQLTSGQAVAILGSHPAIGSWNPARYHVMTATGRGDWMLTVDVGGMGTTIEYKYVVVDTRQNALVEWEGGDNRTVALDELTDGQVLVEYGETLRLPASDWRLAGVVVPVSALRSEKSCGTGDFRDLRQMVDWAVATGMRMIQLLPVNDTTTTHGPNDSHPYNIVSVHALHPHYLSFEDLGPLKDKTAMTDYLRQQRELNAMKGVDYAAVDRVKRHFIQLYFAERGERTLASEGFKAFYADNEDWLLPYAAFCALREKYHTAHFADWEEWAAYRREQAEKMLARDDDMAVEMKRTFFVQYLLHGQLASAAAYARKHGVALKGDVPIGVSRDSVETWTHPELFRMDGQTGAPPDDAYGQGQNWGFPTYDWDRMLGDGCAWWHRRLECMERYFDAFRLDHVLGFFRIWEIPCGAVSSTLGHFLPAMPLSEEEIGSWGLPFRHEQMTQPLINDRILDTLLGMHAAYVKEHFLQPKGYGLYRLRPEVDTQQKVRTLFAGANDENSLWIRDGLMTLLANVLFVEDERMEGMYHPRIFAYREPVYSVLTQEEKDAYMRLYNHYFHERHDFFWGRQALRRLPEVLKKTRMLCCAEDLGMSPQCVPSVLEQLRIFSLEVQTMPKQNHYEFAHLSANPERSVATFSTHDMAPMRLWWQENRGLAQRYFTTMLQKEGRAPHTLTAVLAEEIIARHLYCPSMLCLMSLQDWTAMDPALGCKDVEDERINLPSDPYNQWKYRMPVTMERLMAEVRFNAKLKMMIERSRR